MRQEEQAVHRHRVPVSSLHLEGSQLRAFAFREEESASTQRGLEDEKGEELTTDIKGLTKASVTSESGLLARGMGASASWTEDPGLHGAQRDRALVNGTSCYLMRDGRYLHLGNH